MRTESKQEAHNMSAVTASKYVRFMAESETRGFGDDDNALRRLEARYGLPFWSLRYLKLGRAKKVDSDLFGRIRNAYIDYCGQKVSAFQHAIAVEKAIEPDADLEDLDAAVQAVAAKIAQAKAARLAARRART